MPPSAPDRRFFARPLSPGTLSAPGAPRRPARAAVIGGGLAGLAAAHRLCRAGVPTTVYEGAPQVGGVISSVAGAGGWTHDAGPNSMAAKHPAVHRLIHEELLLGPAVTPRLPGAGGVLVGTGGAASARLPGSLPAAITTPLLSPWGKVRALAEPLIPRRRGLPPAGAAHRPAPESLHAFVTRRFGAQVADRVVDAGVAGIYSASSKVLDVAYALPSLAEAERRAGSVVVGMATAGRAARRAAAAAAATAGGGSTVPLTGGGVGGSGVGAEAAPAPTRKQLRASFNFVGGMATLPRALATTVCASPGCTIRTSTPVTSLSRTPQGTWLVNGRGPEVDALVLAVPAHALPGLVSRPGGGGLLRRLRRRAGAPLPVSLRAALIRLAGLTRYAPITVTALGYARPAVGHPLDAFGVLLPAATPVAPGSSLLGVNFTSSTYGGRAPDGCVLLTAYAGGDRGAVDVAAVKRDVRSLVGVAASPATAAGEGALGPGAAPELYEHVTRWPRGIPIMGSWCGTVNAVAARAEAATPSLRFAGNWRGGVGVPDALRGGLEAGEALAVWLREGGRGRAAVGGVASGART